MARHPDPQQDTSTALASAGPADDLRALADTLRLERQERRLARQNARSRATPQQRNSLSSPVSVDAAIYANVGRYAGSVVLSVFEQMGGIDGMTDWAEENPTEFYTKLFPKIITAPKQVEISGTLTLEEAVKALELSEGDGFTVVDETPATPYQDAEGNCDDPSV